MILTEAFESSPGEALAGGEHDAEGKNYYPCSKPASDGDSGGGSSLHAEELREDENCNNLDAAANAGDLDDAAEGDEAEIDDDVEPGEVVGLGEGAKDAEDGGEDGGPFDDGVEDDQGDIGKFLAGGEAGAEAFEEEADFGLGGGGKEGEGFAESIDEGVAAKAGEDEEEEAGAAEDGDKDAAGLEDPEEGGAKGAAGGIEGGEAEAEEDKDSEEVVDTFEEPGSHLGRDGDVFRAGDEVGADEFSGAAEEDDGGEADEGIDENAAEGGVGIDGAEHDLPAEDAADVAGHDDGGTGNHPAPIDVIVDVGEGGPVEGRQALPGEPDQDGDEEDGQGEGPATD